jgi:hypothetical protein
MKGVFFTEFLHMVEAEYSANMVDDIIEIANLPSKGAYTIVGAYPDEELISLMQCYAEITQLSIPDILKAFGRHLFKRLFPIFLRQQRKLIIQDAFTLFENLDHYVRFEVFKLYPDDERPSFKAQRLDDYTMLLDYTSPAPLIYAIYGVLEAGLQYFGQKNAEILIQDLSVHRTTHAIFTIKLQPPNNHHSNSDCYDTAIRS